MTQSNLKFLFAGGCVAASVAVLVVPESEMPPLPTVDHQQLLSALPVPRRAPREDFHCEKDLAPKASISRAQLRQLLNLQPGASLRQVQAIIPEFRCQVGAKGDEFTRYRVPAAWEPDPEDLGIILIFAGDQYQGFEVDYIRNW